MRGLKVPWVYIRRELAKGWFVPPWVVDGSDEPPDMVEEVRIELRIRQIEAEVEAEKS
jgi:hypothetical protein